ncbi:MAG: glycosyltransferase family 4 protein [Candidatus Heimdallarchaeaceae archaeon]
MSLAKYWSVKVIEFHGLEKLGNNESIIEGVRVTKLGARWWPENTLLKAIIFFLKVFPVLLKIKADVYHCCGLQALIVAAPVKIFARRPLIYDCYEHYPYQFTAPALHKTTRQSIIWNFILCLENAFAKLSDCILVVPSYNNILLDRFKRYKKKPISVIWNLPPIKLLDRKEQTKRTIKGKILLYVGGISKDKGAFKLLDAASKVVIEFPDVKVMMIGPTNILKTLCEYARSLGIEKNVKILKPVAYFDIWKIYSLADIGIILYQPTFWTLRTKASEKLFENMLFSLPIVVSNFPGIREIVKTCNCGILVDPTSSEEISAAIIRLLRDPHAAGMLGKNGRDAVLKRYNWEFEEPKLINIYSHIFKFKDEKGT